MGKIFGIRFRAKPNSGQDDQLPERETISQRRRTRLKRTLWLVPALVILFFMSVVEHGHPAAGKAGKGGLLAALADPLSLFAARSPGERGGGALLSTKPGRPSERVLSNVRDRDPPLGDPGADDPGLPVTPEDVAALTPPADGAAPGEGGGFGLPGGGGGPSFAPFSGPGGDPGFLPGGGLAPLTPPPGTPPPGTPPPSGPGISAVPEPATWAMMIIGFFSVGAAVRRRARRQAGLVATR